MLNARIEFQTDELPYKVKRKMPSLLQPYFTEEDDWMIFCDQLDKRLRPYEEIKASWMILGVAFVILLLGLMAGIFCRFFVVDDDHVGLILSGSLFGGVFVVFTGYFFLMHLWVVKPLDVLSQEINEYCKKIATTWANVEFRFERSKSCSIFWDSDFSAWINILASEPVDLDT
jgi:hypothetical protein